MLFDYFNFYFKHNYTPWNALTLGCNALEPYLMWLHIYLWCEVNYDDPLTLRWYMVLCYVYYGSKNPSEVSMRPLVHGTYYVLSGRPKEPPYEWDILNILIESPKEPLYVPGTLNCRGVIGDMTTMFLYVWWLMYSCDL